MQSMQSMQSTHGQALAASGNSGTRSARGSGLRCACSHCAPASRHPCRRASLRPVAPACLSVLHRQRWSVHRAACHRLSPHDLITCSGDFAAAAKRGAMLEVPVASTSYHARNCARRAPRCAQGWTPHRHQRTCCWRAFEPRRLSQRQLRRLLKRSERRHASSTQCVAAPEKAESATFGGGLVEKVLALRPGLAVSAMACAFACKRMWKVKT